MAETLVTEARSRLVDDESGISVAREFDVIAASELDALNVLDTETGISKGQPYVNAYGEVVDAFVIARRLRVEPRPPAPVGGLGLYRVQVEYSRNTGGGGAEPNEATIEYEWDGQLQSEPVDIDVEGNPITNSAGEQFDPPLTALLPRATVKVTLFKSALPANLALNAIGRINSDDPWSPGDGSGSVARGGALITAVRIGPARGGLRLIQFGIEARPLLSIKGQTFSPFASVTPDRGRRVVTGTEGGITTYEIVKDDTGNPLADPVLLDGAGGRLAAASDPALLSFTHHLEASYSAIGI